MMQYDRFFTEPDDGFLPIVQRNFAMCRAREQTERRRQARGGRPPFVTARAGLGLSVCALLFVLACALAGGMG